MFEAIKQVLPEGPGKDICALAHKGHAAAGDSLGHLVQVLATDSDSPAVGIKEAGEQQRELLLAAAARADKRSMLVKVELDRYAIDDVHLLVVHQSQVADRQLAPERLVAFGVLELIVFVTHSGRFELADNLLVLDLRVLLDLVVLQQLLPRLGQILIGGNGRHQRAESEVATDHQIAADRVKEDGPDLTEKVVEKLGEELELVDAVADVEDGAKPVCDIGEFQVRGVVGVNLHHPLHRFADAARELAHHADPLLAQEVDLALQLRDEINLDRIERDRR